MILVKKIIRNILKKIGTKLIDKAYKFAEELWADGTVEESLKIADEMAAAMDVHDYQIVILMPKWHDEPIWRSIEIGKLMNGFGGMTYPDYHRIEINLFLLGTLQHSFWRSNKEQKSKILAKVREAVVHELRHVQQFRWLETNKDVRERVLASYTLSTWSFSYWMNPLEKDARRYASTGKDVPFEEVFKKFIQ